MASKIDSDLHVNGTLTATVLQPTAGTVTNATVATNADIAASKIQQRLARDVIPLTELVVHDAPQTKLPGAAAADDLGLVGVTHGTDAIAITAGDLKAAGATTMYARVARALPAEYEDGETVTLRAHAGMRTTISDTTATLDFEVFESDKEGVAGGGPTDLCATAAQSINSTTFADYDFQVTPAGLVAGDWLDIRIIVAVNDAATGTAVDAFIGSLELMSDIRA